MGRVRAALNALEDAEEDMRVLTAYYVSGQWLRDYELDEAGRLPPDLKRGVLSEDGLWNLLNDWERMIK